MAVPLDQFGYDHWKLLVYVQERATAFGGALDFRRMRCNLERHPGLEVNGYSWQHAWGSKLKGGRCIPEHDDWDCLDDLENAGLVEIGGTGVNPKVSLTPRGAAAWEALIAHRKVGGLHTNFQWA